jgi:hypothetical protein
MANRVLSECDNCGQYDDHPKLHYGPETYHHDCVPARVMRDITSVTDYEVVENPAAPGGQELRMLARRPLDEVADVPQETLDNIHRLTKIIDKAKSGTRGPKLLTYIEKLHAGEGDEEN